MHNLRPHWRSYSTVFAAAAIVCLTGCSSAPGDHGNLDGASILVFSETRAFRHRSIPAGVRAFEALGAEYGFGVQASEDSAIFNDRDLAAFDAIVFLSTTGDILNESEQEAMERYIQAGGGFRRRACGGRHRTPGRLVLVSEPGRRGFRVAPGDPGGAADGDRRRSPLDVGSARDVSSHRRVVRLPGFVRTPNRCLDGGRTELRRGQARRLSPDKLVPRIRWRPLVLYGAGPHRSGVCGTARPAAPAGRPRLRGRRTQLGTIRGRGPSPTCLSATGSSMTICS